MAQVNGILSLNTGSLVDQHWSSALADVLTAGKMQHIFKAGSNFATAIGGTPATREEVVFVASGAGTMLGFKALLVATGSSTSITFDLKKNGVSILTAVITITNANSARQVLDATLSSTAFVDEDVFSIAMTVGSSTGAQGAYAWLEARENTSPS